MAVLKGGRLHGKVGNLVYYTRNGVSCVRSIPKPSPRQSSAAQQAQRERMKLVSQYFAPLGPMLNDTFKSGDRRSSGINKAVRHAMHEAIAGEYPDLRILPDRVLVSHGSVRMMRTPVLRIAATGIAELTWVAGEWGAQYDDIPYLLVYNVSNGRVQLVGGNAHRNEERMAAQLNDEVRQGTAHCFGFVMDRMRHAASDSVFLGIMVDGELVNQTADE